MFGCRKRFFKNSGNSTLYNGLYGLIEFASLFPDVFSPACRFSLSAREQSGRKQFCLSPIPCPYSLFPRVPAVNLDERKTN